MQGELRSSRRTSAAWPTCAASPTRSSSSTCGRSSSPCARRAARPADHRARRHELRPRRGRLRDPGQRRCDPLVQPDRPRDRGRRSRPDAQARPPQFGLDQPADGPRPSTRGRGAPPAPSRPRPRSHRRPKPAAEAPAHAEPSARPRPPQTPAEAAPVEEAEPARDGGGAVTEISATQVKELRDRTGAGMMDCKRALVETDATSTQHSELLREKGMAAAKKRAGPRDDRGHRADEGQRQRGRRSSRSAARPSRSPRTTSSWLCAEVFARRSSRRAKSAPARGRRLGACRAPRREHRRAAPALRGRARRAARGVRAPAREEGGVLIAPRAAT